MGRIILMAMVLAVTVAGCNRFPDLTIQVSANLVPSDPPECAVVPNQELILLRGRYDLEAPAFDYIITPQIDSYLFDNSLNTQAPQTNFQVTGFEITIKLPDGSTPDFGEALPNPYLVTSSVVIPASTALGGISSGAAAAPGIPSAYRPALDAVFQDSGFNSIVIDIQAFGSTSGGFSQKSPPFSWPIELCEGCLGIECPEPAQEGDGVGCFPGQDGWQWCQTIVPADSAP